MLNALRGVDSLSNNTNAGQRTAEGQTLASA